MIDVLAFMIGLFIFLYPLISSYVNYSEQTKAVDTYDAIVSKLTPSQRAKMWKQAKEYDKELGTPHLRDPFSRGSLRSPLDRYWKTLNVDGHGMMAYVQIPKINVKLPVYHGTSDPILAKGTGHVATTHSANRQQNCSLCYHRSHGTCRSHLLRQSHPDEER